MTHYNLPAEPKDLRLGFDFCHSKKGSEYYIKISIPRWSDRQLEKLDLIIILTLILTPSTDVKVLFLLEYMLHDFSVGIARVKKHLPSLEFC